MGSPVPGPRSPVPGPRSPVPGPRSPVPGPRSPVPGPRSPVPGPRSPVPGLVAQPRIWKARQGKCFRVKSGSAGHSERSGFKQPAGRARRVPSIIRPSPVSKSKSFCHPSSSRVSLSGGWAENRHPYCRTRGRRYTGARSPKVADHEESLLSGSREVTLPGGHPVVQAEHSHHAGAVK